MFVFHRVVYSGQLTELQKLTRVLLDINTVTTNAYLESQMRLLQEDWDTFEEKYVIYNDFKKI